MMNGVSMNAMSGWVGAHGLMTDRGSSVTTELAIARFQGQHVAEITAVLKRGRQADS